MNLWNSVGFHELDLRSQCIYENQAKACGSMSSGIPFLIILLKPILVLR